MSSDFSGIRLGEVVSCSTFFTPEFSSVPIKGGYGTISMALELIGISNGKRVFVTPYAKWRLQLRNLTDVEALQVLHKRDVSYPKDEDGRQKIRSTIERKRAFLVIAEDTEKIIIITGGES